VIAQSSDGTRTLATGKLALVNNEVDQAAGTVRMKASFDNADNALWPGLSVSTMLLVQTLKDAIVVPQDVVQHGPNGLFAYVVDSGNKVDVRPLEVSQRGSGKAVVTKGLAQGDKVVFSGQSRLQKGALIKPTEAKPQESAPSPSAPPQVATTPVPDAPSKDAAQNGK
jgi:multidrug efflux system membrane fusion protein